MSYLCTVAQGVAWICIEWNICYLDVNKSLKCSVYPGYVVYIQGMMCIIFSSVNIIFIVLLVILHSRFFPYQNSIAHISNED